MSQNPSVPAPLNAPIINDSPTVLSDPDSLSETTCWIREINATYAESVAGILRTGEILLTAKEELDHGKWGLLFGPGRLRFGQRRAELFMGIYRCGPLRNPQHFSFLPNAWSVLAILSTIPEQALAQAIADGRVHPELTVRQARELVNSCKVGTVARTGKDTSTANPQFNLDYNRRSLTRRLQQESKRWPKANWPDLAAVLRQAAQDLGASQLSQPNDNHRTPTGPA